MALGSAVAATAPGSAAGPVKPGPVKPGPVLATTVKTASARAGSEAQVALPVSDWPAYLDGPLHASYNASQAAITPATVPMLAQQWRPTASSASGAT